MPTLLPYAKFHQPEEAATLLNLLQTANIPFSLEQEVNQLDDIIIGYSMDPMYVVMLEESQFPIANKLWEENGERSRELEQGYYLYEMSNEELNEVVTSPTEWNAFDQGLAKKILAERNIPIADKQSDAHINFQPASLSAPVLFAGYLLSTTIVGIFFGLSILQNKKVLPDGSKVYNYDNNTRQHANYMIMVSLLSATYILYRIIR